MEFAQGSGMELPRQRARGRGILPRAPDSPSKTIKMELETALKETAPVRETLHLNGCCYSLPSNSRYTSTGSKFEMAGLDRPAVSH